MSISIINNQPIRFQNIESIDTSCDCLGQGFCQLINKNDDTKFQISSSNIVTNGGFESDLTGWETNGGWEITEGVPGATYLELGDNLEQLDILTIGYIYSITFTLSNMNSEGYLVINSLDTLPQYDLDGTYTAIGTAILDDLVFEPVDDGGTLQVTIDTISVQRVYMYSIKDSDGNTVFTQTDETGVTSSGQNIQYAIDWTGIDDGCYQIYLSDESIDYVSDCIVLELTHDCTLLLSWTNDDNAYGFNYSDLTFTQLLRVKAKLWQPIYPKEKTVFKDNAGNRFILKSETSKEKILTIGEMPEYLHDALAIGLEHDDFYIDSVKYTNEETEYTPKWRKSSQLAPSEVIVIKDQLLKNNNC